MRQVAAVALFATVLAACGKSDAADSNVASAVDTEFSGTWATVQESPLLFAHGGAAASSASSRPPVLVYYAIDTEEPFYQAAVDFEVRELKGVCVAADANVRFVAVLNSYFVKQDGMYLKCDAGQLSTQYFPDAVKNLVAAVSSPSLDPAHPAAAGLHYALPWSQKNNGEYAKYPLSSPELLRAVMTEVSTNVFPAAQYDYYLNIKSHGASDLVMAGLSPDLLQKKTDRQTDVLNNYLNAVRTAATNSNANIDLRNRVACEAKGGLWQQTACWCPSSNLYINQFFGACQRVYGDAGQGVSTPDELSFTAIGLGRVKFAATALKDAMGQDGMGQDGMGQDGMGQDGMGQDGMGQDGMGQDGMGQDGMGQDGMGQDGMGIDFTSVGYDGMGAQGMQSDAKFGTTHDALTQVIADLGGAGVHIPMLIIEACETDVADTPDVKAKYAALGNLDALYSAKGSLWYRNFDWDRILAQMNVLTGDRDAGMKTLLTSWTALIPNYVPATGTATAAATSTGTQASSGTQASR